MYFSVVIPLYNKEKSIRNTILSVLNQTYDKFEIIIIDDGSIDGSNKVVQSITDNRIKLYNQDNHGVSHARNNGFIKCSHEHVCLLDADDLWEPMFLEKMAALVSDYPDAGLYCFDYQLSKSGKIIKTKPRFVPDRGVIKDYFKSISQNPRSGISSQSSICVKKSAWKSVGGYPEGVTHTEDAYFCCKIALKYSVVFERYIAATYRLDGENRSSDKKPQENRYVVEQFSDMIKECSFSKKKIKSIKSYIGKNIIHLALNCLEANHENSFNRAISDRRINFISLSLYYKIIYVIFSVLSYKILFFIVSKSRK